jgi:hypothetical protein
VQILRFDPATGWRVADGGSEFTLAPLTLPDGRVKAACFHVPAGGAVGFHEATVPQLFCVVGGSGWVTGADRTRVPVAAFEAAYWAAGELHEAGSDDGMVAVVLEGDVAPYRPTA